MKTIKVTKVTQEQMDSLKWHLMPQDGGRIVVDTYAVDDFGLWLKRFDQSDRTTEYWFARYDGRSWDVEFEPWNNKLPKVCKFKRVRLES